MLHGVKSKLGFILRFEMNLLKKIKSWFIIKAYNPKTKEKYDKITSWEFAKIIGCHKNSVNSAARKANKTIKGFVVDLI